MAVSINNDINTIILTVNVPGMQGPAGPSGPKGDPGEAGPSTNISVGDVVTGNPGDSAAATITGTSPSQVLNLTIPQGPQGIQGPQGPPGQDGAGISIAGSVVDYASLPTGLTGADAGKGYLVQSDGLLYIWDGSSFPADGSGVAFRGPAGPANTLTVGSVTTGVAGSSVSVSVTGTAPNQTLNVSIPRGDQGAPGAPGAGIIAGGAVGSVLAKATTTDYDTQWLQSSSSALAATLVIRDSNGRAQVSDPATGNDIANKTYVDVVGGRVTTLETANSAATSAPTASTLMKRDINGRAQVNSPSATGDIATKGYVDTQDATKVTGFADPGADRIVFWDDSANTYAPLIAGTGLTISSTTMSVRSASTSQTGIVELADNTETAAGTDSTKAVTPSGLTSMLPEAVQDIVGAFLVGGDNVTTFYDDASNTYTINSEAGGISSVDYADLPAGTTITVSKSGGTWPLRPTDRSDIFVIWKGPDPNPPIVSSGTGGALDNVDSRFVTP